MMLKFTRILAFTAVLILLLPTAVVAAPPFPLNDTTTWDSDMINIEAVSQTGKGVYVAVLDTGLVPNWRDYFDLDQVNVKLGTGFYQPISFKAHKDACALGVEVGKVREATWVGSISSAHGTHVASTIIGYNYHTEYDVILPPIKVRGLAPDVTIIPVKVLADYHIPALPKCEEPLPAMTVTSSIISSAR